MRVRITEPPFTQRLKTGSWNWRGAWPCAWVSCAGAGAAGGNFVSAYRLRVRLARRKTVRVHVSADQRYELFLDGVRLGRGPERGDPANWYYESYDLRLAAGAHVLVARVWTLELAGCIAPAAQMSVRPGFLLAAEAPFTELLSTGCAAWDAKLLPGYAFAKCDVHAAGELAGGVSTIDGARFAWGVERGRGAGWRRAEVREPARDAIDNGVWGEVLTPRLRPAPLPPMREAPWPSMCVRFVEDPGRGNARFRRVVRRHHRGDEQAGWQNLCNGEGRLTIPARTRRRVIVDLQGYGCVYPALTLSGGRGSVLRLGWSEALWEDDPPRHKGNRDVIEGKLFLGRWHTVLPDGGRRRTFATLWWECGRYLELQVQTAGDPLTLEGLALMETRYPLEMEGRVALSDARFNAAVPVMFRTLQMCAHETYFDCPFYEQLMYAGDTRLQALTTYVATRDDRLPRKALAMFGASQLAGGLTQSRYPCNRMQVIPQFSLYWVGMVHDFALWRGDRAFVRGLLPGMRGVVEAFLAAIGADGLLRYPAGWNWIDWVPEWQAEKGSPPLDASGLNGINHLQLVMVLGNAAALERWAGEPAFAERLERVRRALLRRTVAVFWDARRGLFADTPAKDAFSEHAQCFALLTGLLTGAQRRRVAAGLLGDPALARATIYFRHYLFEVFRQLRMTDEILSRLALWYGLKDLGLKTCIEAPEPSRSDCHAWGAHPIYHALASVLGIRPAGYGFASVEIAPDLGSLAWARGRVPHPRGDIVVELQREGNVVRGAITLPRGLAGVFVQGGRRRRLRAGQQRVG